MRGVERTDSSSDRHDIGQKTGDEAGDARHINNLALLNWSGKSTEEQSWQSQSGGELHLAGGYVAGKERKGKRSA